jgi:hypothetical protein
VKNVFLYRDREGASRIWQDNFSMAAMQQGLRVIDIAFESRFEHPKKPGSILKRINRKYQSGDIFIARFNERKEHLIEPLYSGLEEIFGEKHIFPDRLAYYFYNNKKRQAEFFNRHNIAVPVQCWVRDPDELYAFMRNHDLKFPMVRKESRGAGSVGVSLIDAEDTAYPFVAQEFCRNNAGDLRIMTVGEKVFGFARKNRENDFRASGSGMIEYLEALPLDCVKLAHRVASECRFVCMAFDFIKNNQDRWVIAEMSYTFVSEPASRCRYYYSAADHFQKKDQPVGSVERLILESLRSSEK